MASVLLCLCIGGLAAYTIVLLGWIEEHAWSQLTPQQQQQQITSHAGHKGLSYPAIGRIIAPNCVCSCFRGAPPPAGGGATSPGPAATRGTSEHFQQLATENDELCSSGVSPPPPPAAATPPRGCQCNVMSSSIATAIVATSVGVGAAYLDFIASTLVSIFPSSGVGQTGFMLLTLLPVLPLAMVSSYKYLAFTSILGDIAVAAGIVVVVLFGAFGQSDSSDTTTAGGAAWVNGTDVAAPPLAPGAWEDGEAPLFNGEGIFQVVGSVAFLFAVHIVVLPVVQSMRERSAFGRVVYGSMAGVAVTNTVFGVACAVLFASLTQPNVIDNLDDGPVSVTVKVLLCVDLLFTIPMVLAAGRQVLERAVMSCFRREKQRLEAMGGASVTGGGAGAATSSFDQAVSGAKRSLMSAHHATTQHVDCTHVTAAAPSSESSAPPAPSGHIAPAPPLPTETAPLRVGGAETGAGSCTAAPKCGKEAIIIGVIRLSLVLVMAAAAITIPNFEVMVTLVGGLVNSFTGFVFPPLLYLELTGANPRHKPSVWSSVAHCAIAVFGLLAAILTTTFTIQEMVK